MAERILPRNVAHLYEVAARQFGDDPAFAHRRKKGPFEFVSFRELFETGRNLATGLIDLGVSAHDHVGLIADNRLEWILCDCGVQLCGAADVPRAADITESEIKYILDHADVEVVFVEDAETLSKLKRCAMPGIRVCIVMDPEGGPIDGALRLADVIDRGARLRREGDRRVEERMAGIQPDDLFTLIYTSGTTGTPKGVQLTHANMVSQIANLPFPLERGWRTLSILPVWHSYERVFEMLAVGSGLCTYYTNLRSISEDLKIAKPNVMASAPRLWENIYLKIFSNVKSAPPQKKALFKLAYSSAVKVHRAQKFFIGQQLDTSGRSPGESLALLVGHLASLIVNYIPYRVLDGVVLKKLRAIVGGEFRGTISGGGALQPHVDEFFNFIGIPVLEGYGLTETSPVLAVRHWKNLVIGTVGPVYPKTEVRIVDLDTREILYPSRRKGRGRGLRGEIHVKGPQVMKGYYKDDEATSRVLKDGWFNTGDIGMMTFNNCLKILGRSKDTIVLLSGENVEPTPIENHLSRSHLIDQCMVVGQDQKFLSALIVPSMEAFETAGIKAASALELADRSVARTMVEQEIRKLVSAETGFKPFERVVAWRFLPKRFEIGDELTATLKLRRHVVAARYKDVIDGIYS